MVKNQPQMPMQQPYQNVVSVNEPNAIGVRRVAQLFNATRTAVQTDKDNGVYTRPQVGPIEYAESNIKKSHYNPGVAGYVQHGGVLTDNADDQTVQEYMSAYMQSMKAPVVGMQAKLMNPKQNFLQTKLAPEAYEAFSGNMADNLLSIARMKKQQPAK